MAKPQGRRGTKPKLGSGERFKALSKKVGSKKLAVIVKFSEIVIVLLCSVEPSDQLENTYPVLGVADKVTCAP